MKKKDVLDIEVLIQLMRNTNLAQVRRQLERIKNAKGEDFPVIHGFYEAASRQRK